MIKNILKWSVVGGLFLVPFIAFIVPSAMFFPFITGKGFAFRILIEIVFGLYVCLATVSPDYRPKFSWMTKSIGLFILAIFVADIFGANTYKSMWSNYERMEGFVLLAHLGLYYIVASSVLSVKQWGQFWNTSIFASVVMSLYGILQLAGKVAINQGGVRLDATFGNAAYLAIYLVFHIFLSLYMLVQSGKPAWQRWIYGSVVVLETCILYFTATRGAILGFIGGLILTALLMMWKEKGITREHMWFKRSARIFLIAMVVIGGAFFGLKNTEFIQKSPVLSRFASISKSEIINQGRYFVWPMAVKGFLEKPILGWGQENFNFVFNKNYDPRMYGQEQWFDRTHNVVLDWLIAGGLLGLLAYLSMFTALFYYIWRQKSQMTVVEKSILTGLIVAYVFHNMFVFDNLISYIMFFSLLGFVHTVNAHREDVHVYANKNSRFHSGHVTNDVSTYIVFPVAAIATVLVVYFVNVPALSANRTLIKAITPQTNAGGPEKNLEFFKKVFEYGSLGDSEALEQLVQVTNEISGANDLPVDLKQKFVAYTQERIEEKVKKTPEDARYQVFAGGFFNRITKYDLALPYLQKAVELSPRKQSMYFELGTADVGKKEYSKALEAFETAYKLDTSYKNAKVIYAIGALYNKNAPLYKQLTDEIGAETIISDNRFLRAYADMGDYGSVIQILTLRIQKEPTNVQYKLSLASTYLQIGQKQKSISIIQEMIKADPSFKDQGEAYIKQIQNS